MAMRVRVVLAAVVSTLLVVGVVAGPPVAAADGPTVSLGDQSGLERDSVTGSVFVPVYLSAPVAEPVVVSFYTVDGTATAGVDYVRWGTPTNPRTVTVPAGQVQAQINVPLGFADPDPVDKAFTVVISSVSGGDALVGRDTATATIVDSDAVFGPNPAINVSNPTIVEGDVGQRRAQFQIQLSRPPATPVTVTYATEDGTALAGEDYVPRLPGTIVFAPGQISRTVDVLVNSNTTIEGDRQFFFDVDVIGGSPVEELNMTGVATILDDDTVAPEPCPPGTFSENGTEPCEPAPPGTYVDTEGATQPTPCPDGTTTLTEGATSIDDCVTPPLVVTAVSAGGDQSCALLSDGTARCWGRNFEGQLGNGTNINSNLPVTVTGITNAVDIAAGSLHTCALLDDGTARCWGRNNEGQLGNGTTTGANLPVAVTGLDDAISITAGRNHTCALLVDGTARCWGSNSFGLSSQIPVAVPELTDAVSIDAGGEHTCAVLEDGTARCWGNNSNGQLGNGTSGGGWAFPVVVTGLDDVAAITAGWSNSCALLVDGSARCWGGLDIPFGNSSSVPVVVAGLADGATIDAGRAHNCASLVDGTARCWGSNSNGQLGNGSGTNSATPVVVTGLSNMASVTTGWFHSCALLVDGTVQCWGDNFRGQVGNGTTGGNSIVPVAVVGIP